jgi:uncharacterized protein YpuA (DUF1002 family)
MAYIYLLNLYEKIDERLNIAKQSIDDLSNEADDDRFVEGRMKALSELKEFLVNNLNAKLPRKIRKQINKKD